MVSVIIANYFGDEFLENCIKSIKQQTHKNFEIIVVSDSNTAKNICSKLNVQFQFSPNKGLASAYNCGAKISIGEYLFFMNPDIVLEKDCIFNLVNVIEKDKNIFSVDSLQFDKDGNVIHSKTVLKKGRFFNTFIPGIENIQIETNEVSEVPWTSAGAMLVRKEYFNKLNGFDENYFMEIEDTDLCWRASLNGYKCFFVPDAKLTHFVGGCSTGKRFKRTIEWNKGLLRFTIKFMSKKVLLMLVLSQILRIVFNILRLNFKRSIAILLSIIYIAFDLFSAMFIAE